MAFLTGNTSIDALLAGNGYRWNAGAAVGTPVTITYSFPSTLPGYYAANAAERNGFQAVTAGMKAGIRAVLDVYEQVCNVTFVEASSGVGQMTFAQSRMGSGSAAYAYYGGSTGVSGDVFFNVDYAPNKTLTPGTYGFMTAIHEIGHAMGLKHPGNYNAGGGGTAGPYLPASTDKVAYTVMSYNGGTLSNANPQTLQLFDIRALQYLYGANMNWAIGDDSYSISNAAPVTKTIWDAGGTDTIDASNQTRAATIRLTAGSFSSIGVNASGGAAVNNFAIAYGATIENAIGGSGNDTIFGNAVDNILTGGAGNDVIDGGAGNDTAVFSGQLSQYRIWRDGAQIKVVDRSAGVDGSDILTGIESLSFSDTTILAGSVSANIAPVGVGTPTALAKGASVALSALYAATDAEDTIQYYRVTNPTGAGSLVLNGAVNLANTTQRAQGISQFSAADFAKVTYTGNGSETLSFMAHDGIGWSAVTAVAIRNAAPVGAGTPTAVAKGASVALTALYAATDAEDTVQYYRVTNPTGAGSLVLNGAVNLANATQRAQGISQFSAADFAKVTYTGNGSETLSFMAHDGIGWSAVTAVAIRNAAPVGAGTPTAVAKGASVALTALYAATDAEDTVQYYRVTNPTGAGSLVLNGAVNLANATQRAQGISQFSAADFAKVTYTGNGSETLSFMAHDGLRWNAATNVAVTNAAPVGVGTPTAVAKGASVDLSDLYSATDAEDTVQYYRVTNPAGAGSLVLNGAVNMLTATQQAQGIYQFTASDFAKVTYTGNGSETLSFMAHDGLRWNAATNVAVTNAAPVGVGTPTAVAKGASVDLSDLYSATDAEDTVQYYRVTNPAGAGSLVLNGAV
ncbi:M10 family metallopeptidase C-terminal domain-containing protein, partial [Azospirillum oleiclasticum]